MAVTGTGPVLSALTAGQDILAILMPGTGYVSSVGTLQPIVRQIRRGSAPWRAVGATELAVEGEAVRIREIGFNAARVGAAFYTATITPTFAPWVITTAPNQIEYVSTPDRLHPAADFTATGGDGQITYEDA